MIIAVLRIWRRRRHWSERRGSGIEGLVTADDGVKDYAGEAVVELDGPAGLRRVL